MKRLDPYTKLFEDRIIFLGVQVDDASADDVIAQLIVLESQDPDRDILMYINSPGGSFTAMTAIYDTMQYIRPDVQTFVIGQAASAAAVLLSAGAKGKRFALPNARILIHQPALAGGDGRPGLRHRDPGQRGAAHAHLARGDLGAATPAARPSRSATTSSATRSSPPRRPRSTASSTRCSTRARPRSRTDAARRTAPRPDAARSPPAHRVGLRAGGIVVPARVPAPAGGAQARGRDHGEDADDHAQRGQRGDLGGRRPDAVRPVQDQLDADERRG